MKKLFVLLFLMISTMRVIADDRDSIPVNPSDVSSPDAIIKALYNVISGPAGEKRNWDRMRTLFPTDARLMPTGKRPDGEGVRKSLTVEDYITASGPVLEKNGFFETEIGRRTDQYGNIMQVFSTYESRKTKEDDQPFMRGINSFQLWNDGKRWWILSILWESETLNNPIPSRYIGAIE